MPDITLKFFEYGHLKPPEVQETSKLFHALAHDLEERLPDNEQKHLAMQKLLEAKDCAVRSKLHKYD